MYTCVYIYIYVYVILHISHMLHISLSIYIYIYTYYRPERLHGGRESAAGRRMTAQTCIRCNI